MKTFTGNLNVLAGNIFAYQLLVEKVRTYLLLKNGDKKNRKKMLLKRWQDGWWDSSSLWNFSGSNEWILTNAWIQSFKKSTNSGGLCINPSSICFFKFQKFKNLKKAFKLKWTFYCNNSAGCLNLQKILN